MREISGGSISVPSRTSAPTLPRVVFFHRKPYSTGNYSIETIFADLRKRLAGRIKAEVFECRYFSRGIVKRLANTVEAAYHQGDVNVITGDIHYVSLFLAKRKTLLVIHDCGFYYSSKGLKRALEKLFWYTLPVARVASVVTVSEFSKEEILRLVSCPGDKVVVIPDPVADHYTFTPKPFRQDRPVLLQVGQTANKNLFRIIEAIRGLDVKLVIIGQVSGPMLSHLQESGIDFEVRCRLTDQEMFNAYVQCDMLVFPSTYEGFGMPIVEAQRVGRPVVTSNVASMPWVAGDAACLVDPLSVASIREGILKVWHDAAYREELVARGRVNAERFDPRRIADQYLELILMLYNDR